MKSKVVLGFSLLSLTVGVALTPTDARAQTAHGANGQETIFTPDTSNAALGEAWREPDVTNADGTVTRGMIWGDIVKNDDNGNGVIEDSESIRYMVQSSEYMASIGKPLPAGVLGAKEYCESIGAELPSREDFARLRGYMGATTAASAYEGTDYLPQVLPHLFRNADGRLVSNHFWTSPPHPDNLDYAYVFYGRSGHIYIVRRDYANDYTARCVVPRSVGN